MDDIFTIDKKISLKSTLFLQSLSRLIWLCM